MRPEQENCGLGGACHIHGDIARQSLSQPGVALVWLCVKREGLQFSHTARSLDFYSWVRMRTGTRGTAGYSSGSGSGRGSECADCTVSPAQASCVSCSPVECQRHSELLKMPKADQAPVWPQKVGAEAPRHILLIPQKRVEWRPPASRHLCMGGLAWTARVGRCHYRDLGLSSSSTGRRQVWAVSPQVPNPESEWREAGGREEKHTAGSVDRSKVLAIPI